MDSKVTHRGVFFLGLLARRLRTQLWMRALVAILCLNFALPLELLGDEFSPDSDLSESVPESPSEQAANLSLAELQRQISESTSASSRLALDFVKRNVGFLLRQELVDSQTGKSWDLTIEDLARPRVSVAAGLVNRILRVEKMENGVVLGLEGNRYRHRILFNPGTELVDFDWDSEVVELLLSDGSRHVIEVSSLGPTSENMAQGLLFSASVPVFFLGIAKSPPGKNINRIRILQRRVDPVDRSRAAQLARLDRNPSTREKGLVSANRGLVNRVRENLELVRPIQLSPELEQQLQANSEDGKAWLYAGDTAVIHADGHFEEIVAIDSRLSEVGMIGLQMGPLSGLWYVASPESTKATRELFELRTGAKQAVDDLLSDELNLRAFFQDGLQRALSHIPASALNATNDYARRIAARVVELKAQHTEAALRDAFTLEQQLDDYHYFTDYLGELEERTRAHELKNRLNPSKYPWARRMGVTMSNMGSGIKNFDIAKRMQQATTALKWPLIIGTATVAVAASGAGADYMMTHGQNVGLAVDTLASTWNHVQDYAIPIMRDFSYVKNMALYSLSSRTANMAAILAIAAIACPFLQHSINKLITRAGLKYFFSASIIPPQRLLATLTGRPELVEAMKKGFFPRELFNPMGRFSSSYGERLETVSRRIDDRNYNHSIATAIALTAMADRSGVDPAKLLSIPDLARPSSNLALALTDLLSSSNRGQLFRALSDDPAAFFKSLVSAHQQADELIKSGATEKRSGLALMRTLATGQILSGIGNFGEARYQALRDPQPPQDFADYVVRGYLVDGIFTLLLSSFVGSYANPANGDDLAFQQNGVLWTNKKIWINDWEQIFLHLGASAAVDFMSAGLDSKGAFSFMQPANAYDADRVVASRSFGADGARATGLLFNLRKNNYLVGFGTRSWNQCVRLIQGFFVIGMGLRLFEGVLDGDSLSSLFTLQTFEHASVGQLYFVFVAPFVYRWFWAVAITTTRTLEEEIKAMSKGYRDHFYQLVSSIERKDLGGAQREAAYLVELYSHEYRGVPPEVVEALTIRTEENPLEWANRVLEACRNTPPVPETANEGTNKSIIFIGSVITTYLAGFLMVDSFQNRPFRGFDVPEGAMGFDASDWWAWNGMSRADSMPALMMKSLLNIWALWGVGHLFNIGWDKVAGNDIKNTTAAVDGLISMPGLQIMKPAPKLLTPSVENCAELLTK